MPNKFLYKPWELEKKYQEQINVVIGKDYPEPMVDHATARIAALDAFQKIKKSLYSPASGKTIALFPETII